MPRIITCEGEVKVSEPSTVPGVESRLNDAYAAEALTARFKDDHDETIGVAVSHVIFVLADKTTLKKSAK